jgi:hypothetical protein
MQFIADHNLKAKQKKSTYLVRMNQFGDMTHAEYLRFIRGFDRNLFLAKKNKKMLLFTESRNKKLPQAFGT